MSVFKLPTVTADDRETVAKAKGAMVPPTPTPPSVAKTPPSTLAPGQPPASQRNPLGPRR